MQPWRRAGTRPGGLLQSRKTLSSLNSPETAQLAEIAMRQALSGEFSHNQDPDRTSRLG